MLENTKHKKDRMVLSILSTLVLVTGSSEIYASAQIQNYAFAKEPTNSVQSVLGSGTQQVGLVQASYMQGKIQELESELKKTETLVELTKLQGEEKLEEQIEKYETVDALIEKLYTYVGKTPYALSGSTPKAWDCSGLTMWFYERYKGITLEHSASKQAALGEKVDAPIPGDIVAFYYNGRKSSFHVGIYVGGGRFIHAKNRSEDTVLETVDGFAKNNIKVAYIRY